MELSPQDTATLKAQAESGDVDAKEILAAFTPKTEPVKEPSEIKTPETVTVPAPEEAPKPTETAADNQKVEQPTERDGKQERKPSKIDTIRELRADRRRLAQELEAERRQQAERFAALEKKLESLATGNKPKPTDEDELARLLSKPSEYFADMKRQLLEEARKQAQEEFKNVPNELQRRAEHAQALKVINSIEGFDQDADEEELFEILERDYNVDEDMLRDMTARSPVKAANFIKNVWGKRNSLSPKAVADKVAAASGTASGSKPNTSKPTLKELNARFAEAARKGDDKAMAEIESQIGAMLSGS